MLVKVFHQHHNFTNIPKFFSPTYKNFSPTCFTNIHLNFYIHQHTFHQHPKIIHQHTEIIHQHTFFHQHTSPTSLQSSERFLLFESLRSCVKFKVESPYKFHGPEKDCIQSKMTVYISQRPSLYVLNFVSTFAVINDSN